MTRKISKEEAKHKLEKETKNNQRRLKKSY